MADITPSNPQGAGRNPKTEQEIKEEKEWILRKLEPYLKTGLSINKALGEAQISNHVFYEYLKKDETFRERINVFRNFIPILLNNIITGELMEISAKQNPPKGQARKKLTKEDKEFLWKFALNSNLTKGEFGERKSIDLFDPEVEIAKVKGIVDEGTTEDIDHSDEVSNDD